MCSKRLFVSLFLILFSFTLFSQSFFAPSDTLNKKRLYGVATFGAVAYTGFSIALYQTWYKKFERQSFHFFNDTKEWNQMDKLGHVHSAYFQSLLTYKGARWTGLSENSSILTGIICGTLFQSTIEVMDGFSSKWGFSIGDIAANNVGIATFALQQKIWKEQRISIKVSSIPISHPNFIVQGSDPNQAISLKDRASDLFGSNYFERFLKDYNAQTYWASVDVKSFLSEDSKWPDWLNLAFGYGSENMYGGFNNTWETQNNTFSLDNRLYPRHRQYYLGFDVNLTKVKTNNHFVKSVLSIFNIFKVPSPAIEINSLGEIKFHILR